MHVRSSFPAPASSFVSKRTSQGLRLQNGSHARVSPCHGFDQRNGSSFRIVHVSVRFGLDDSTQLDSTRLNSIRFDSPHRTAPRRAARATLHGRCCFCRSRTHERSPGRRIAFASSTTLVLSNGNRGLLLESRRSSRREECFTKKKKKGRIVKTWSVLFVFVEPSNSASSRRTRRIPRGATTRLPLEFHLSRRNPLAVDAFSRSFFLNQRERDVSEIINRSSYHTTLGESTIST